LKLTLNTKLTIMAAKKDQRSKPVITSQKNEDTATKSNRRSQEIKHSLRAAGYLEPCMIIKTLQGSVWRASPKSSPRNTVIIKVIDKHLHSKSISIVNGKQYTVSENIIKEMNIQKYLTFTDDQCPPHSIVKYVGCFSTKKDIYFIQEDGGDDLFSFIVKAHKLIESGQLEITEWHKIIKVIFKQMIECIEYIHSKNICHMDISCENWLIKDVPVIVQSTPNGLKIQFQCDQVQVKLCDFGLAEMFDERSSFECNKYCGKTNYKSPEIISKKKKFNAKSNDIWCLGICLFMMIIGSNPWKKASIKDPSFNYIMNKENKDALIELFDSWNRLDYVDGKIVVLFQSIFKYEKDRCGLSEIQRCSWLSSRIDCNY